MKTSSTRAILLRPLVTEKTLRESQTRNAYTFVVHANANKIQIRHAVESLFDVVVTGIRTDVRPGKPRRAGRKPTVTASWKRAVITVKTGQSIDVY